MTIVAKPSVLEWKDGEFEYCANLVEDGGDNNVPRNAIDSYLDVQIVSARQDNRPDVVEALKLLKKEWSEVTISARCL